MGPISRSCPLSQAAQTLLCVLDGLLLRVHGLDQGLKPSMYLGAGFTHEVTLVAESVPQ